jgi:hypothetical protein
MTVFRYDRFTPQAQPRLLPFETLQRATPIDGGTVLRFYRAASLPILLGFLLATAFAAFAKASDLLAAVLLAAQAVPYLWFGLIWQREVLLGSSVARIRDSFMIRRLTAYAGVSLLGALVLGLPWILAEISVLQSWDGKILNLPDAIRAIDPGVGVLLCGSAAYLLLIGIVARFSLVLPAVAIDEKVSLVESWRLTRNNGLRLWLCTVVPALVTILLMVLVLGALQATGMTTALANAAGDPRFLFIGVFLGLWILAVQMIGLSILYGALALAYRQLTCL